MSAPMEPDTFAAVMERRFGRRAALKALAGGGGVIAAAPVLSLATACQPDQPGYDAGELTFNAVAPSTGDALVVADGFAAEVLLSWGDPVVPGAPAFDVANQTAAAQAQQAGFNHDYVDFRPLPDWSSTASDHGLLWVNHEYTDSTMMLPGYTSTAAEIDIEIAAHGGSLVEVSRDGSGLWSYDPDSAYNRRITGSTPITLSGPVAGDVRVQTTADPTGTAVLGMLNNCGGGNTPWGTILTAEENFDQYFGKFSTMPAGYAKTACATYGPSNAATSRKWETTHPRFDLSVEPNEILRFGYVVEIDPYDPTSTPKKRTALGRFKHEAASGILAADGRYVSYSGDDAANQCIYKFITQEAFQPGDRAANMDLLDHGRLYVAKFAADGTGQWVPLTFGSGALTAPNFTDQNDVLLRARQAAAAQGGTKMARPEDIDVSPTTHKVYCVMTGNSGAVTNAANPRSGGSSIAGQGLGHVIEITEDGGDNAALTFTWEVLLLCGEPDAPGSTAVNAPPLALAVAPDNITWYGGFWEASVSPIARPDNAAFDSEGYLFLTTDGQPSALQRSLQGVNDAIFAVPVEGSHRGHAKALLYGPDGCELTGPFLTPDDRTLFFSIQHPGVDLFTWTSPTSAPSSSLGTYAAPGSVWNRTAAATGTPGVPRAATCYLRRLDGGEIAYGPAIDPDALVASGEPTQAGLPNSLVAGAAVAAGVVALRNRCTAPPAST